MPIFFIRDFDYNFTFNRNTISVFDLNNEYNSVDTA